MTLDLLLQQALKAVVAEIKGFSAEELEKKLQESKESAFAQTVDFLVDFHTSNPYCFEDLIIFNTNELMHFWQMEEIEISYTYFECANDDEYLIAA